MLRNFTSVIIVKSYSEYKVLKMNAKWTLLKHKRNRNESHKWARSSVENIANGLYNQTVHAVGCWDVPQSGADCQPGEEEDGHRRRRWHGLTQFRLSRFPSTAVFNNDLQCCQCDNCPKNTGGRGVSSQLSISLPPRNVQLLFVIHAWKAQSCICAAVVDDMTNVVLY